MLDKKVVPSQYSFCLQVLFNFGKTREEPGKPQTDLLQLPDFIGTLLQLPLKLMHLLAWGRTGVQLFQEILPLLIDVICEQRNGIGWLAVCFICEPPTQRPAQLESNPF